MTHYMNLKKQPFEMIKSGNKTIELRLFDEKRALININDEIIFNCDNETLTVKVLALHRFNDFSELYKSLDLKNKLPTMTEDEMLTLLATDGMLVKRPIIIGADFVLVGFKEVEWNTILK